MPGFFKAAMLVVSSGTIAGTGALWTLPENVQEALFAAAPIPDPAPAPCQYQRWPNTDRACQPWTVAHREVARLLSREPTLAETSREPPAARVATEAPDLQARRPRATYPQRIVREDGTARGLAFRPSQRNVIWPTSREDAFQSAPAQRHNSEPRIFAYYGAPGQYTARPRMQRWKNTGPGDF
jgi:hypothetical protein